MEQNIKYKSIINHLNQSNILAYVDEVGRGAMFGELIACCLIIKNPFFHPLINDSKKLSSKQRQSLIPIIIQNSIYNYGLVSVNEINSINNLDTSNELAMIRALNGLSKTANILFLDGNKKINHPIKQIPVIKGDSQIFGIACASILAKEYRDSILLEYDKQFPNYHLASHKGYLTKLHKEAIQKHGITKLHRNYNLK